MELFLDIVSLLVLSIWVGAMFGFGAFFAPALFRRLERAEAGMVAGAVLGRVESLGLVASGVLVVVVTLQGMAAGWQWLELIRLLLVVKLLSLTLVSVMGIKPKMDTLKAEAGAIHALPEEDPRQEEFGRLHKLSTALFTVNLLLGILLIALTAAR